MTDPSSLRRFVAPSLLSLRHLRSLLAPSSPLSDDARALLRTMLDWHSIGRQRALVQADLAAHSGISARRIQQLNLELERAGVVVCTTCGDRVTRRMGQYLAETEIEASDYRDQLEGRAKLCFIHVQAHDQAVRIARDQAAQDRHGAGTLWQDAPAEPGSSPADIDRNPVQETAP